MTRRRILGALAALALAAVLTGPGGARGVDPTPYLHLVGALHNHSGYSDGWPGTAPATLRGQDLRDQRRTACNSLVGSQTTYCRNRITMLALTSPIYLR